MISVTQGFGTNDIIAGTFGDAGEAAAPTYAPYAGHGGSSSWLPPPRVVLRPAPRPRPRLPPRPREELPPRYIPWPPAPPPRLEPTALAAPPDLDRIDNPWLKAAAVVAQAQDELDALPKLRDIAVAVAGRKLARRLVTDLINDIFRAPGKNPRKKK